MRRKLTSAVGQDAAALRYRWRCHEYGQTAACKTIFAVFGVASPLGRIADRFTFINPPYSM